MGADDSDDEKIVKKRKEGAKEGNDNFCKGPKNNLRAGVCVCVCVCQ